MKAALLLLFLATGVCSGLSAMYIAGGYANGLPAKWWSSLLVFVPLAASLGMIFAGFAVFSSMRLGRVVALCSGGLLEVFLLAGVWSGMESFIFPARDYTLNWTPFAGFVLVPFLLVTGSLLAAWRLR